MIYYFIGTVIWGIVWGVACNKVIENKGYDENWFWWGFFFGFIAFIVALTKPDNHHYYEQADQYGNVTIVAEQIRVLQAHVHVDGQKSNRTRIKLKKINGVNKHQRLHSLLKMQIWKF